MNWIKYKDRNKSMAIDALNGESFVALGRKHNRSTNHIRMILMSAVREVDPELHKTISRSGLYKRKTNMLRAQKERLIKLIGEL